MWVTRPLPLHGFPGGRVVKNPHANAGDAGSIPGSGRSPGEGNGNSLQCSCQENSTDRGAWLGYSPWGCKESDMTEHTHRHIYMWHYLLENNVKSNRVRNVGMVLLRMEYGSCVDSSKCKDIWQPGWTHLPSQKETVSLFLLFFRIVHLQRFNLKIYKAKWLSEEALQIAVKEEKRKAKEKRKDISIWMQSSKE